MENHILCNEILEINNKNITLLENQIINALLVLIIYFQIFEVKTEINRFIEICKTS